MGGGAAILFTGVRWRGGDDVTGGGGGGPISGCGDVMAVQSDAGWLQALPIGSFRSRGEEGGGRGRRILLNLIVGDFILWRRDSFKLSKKTICEEVKIYI